MLADLDELVLKCRDERARAYIREAVECCKAGAYRSAIVSTWIAVVFDIIDKIRELALAGDAQAAEMVEHLDNTIATHDLSASLAFERKLLDVARDKFELVSPQEHTDLERLQQDRHRCAHPSLVSPERVFSPTAEMARMHVRNAIEHLLQYEPAQGKAALEQLTRDINSEYFPGNEDLATQILTKGPLRRARKALVRNLIVVILKSAPDTRTQYKQNLRNHAVLNVIRKMHPAIWLETLAADLTRLYRGLSTPDELAQGIRVVWWHEDFMTALDTPQRIRLQEFTRNLPSEQASIVELVLNIPALSEAAKSRVSWMSVEEISSQPWLTMPPSVRKRVVEGFRKAHNYERANAWGKVIADNAYDFEVAEVREIILAAGANSEVKESFELPKVLLALRGIGKVPKGEFNELVKAAGLPAIEEAQKGEFDPDIPF
jgi:hypothetical protein